MTPLARLADLGATAQAAIPGLYAWATTVLPLASVRGSSPTVRLFAALGAVCLVLAPIVEARAGSDRLAPLPGGPRAFARALSLWGLVLTSAVVWAFAPASSVAAKIDLTSGTLGVAGWALFAFACAGPALRPEPDARATRLETASPPRARAGDGLYVAGGVIAAFGLQAIGWNVTVVERAVLVRLVTLAAGVAVLAAASDIALARHRPARIAAPAGRRLRRATPWLLLGTFAFALGWLAKLLGIH